MASLGAPPTHTHHHHHQPAMAMRSSNNTDASNGPGGSEDETDELDMDGVQSSLTGKEDETVTVLDDAGKVVMNPLIVADSYLPVLFGQYGALAARHIVAYLANAHPRFQQLTPTKQRRLVVQALELRKGVMFEKAGWGRWTLVEGNVRGQPLQHSHTPESVPTREPTTKRTPSLLGTSYSADFMFSPAMSMSADQGGRDDDIDVDPLDLDHDQDSETDEEDWKTLGADGLRSRGASLAKHGGLSSSVAVGSPSYSGSPASRFAQSFHAGCPYPMRRKSSAGVFQMKSPVGLHFQKGPTRPAGNPKGGLISTMQHHPPPPQHQRRSPSQTVRSPNPQSSLGNGFVLGQSPSERADADAVEALCMLSRSTGK